MSGARRTLAIVPARGGSKGLPAKNLRPLAGLPLLAYAIRLAHQVPEITRCVVSTDDPAIAEAARAVGGDVPFLRPAELAADDTPMPPVLRHALSAVETGGESFDTVVLLMPTAPVRRASDVSAALDLLAQAPPDVDGVVSVSEPPFNPAFVGVRDSGDGVLARYGASGVGAAGPVRRQDAQPFLRINGLFYVWRASFVRRPVRSWLDEGRHLGWRTDDFAALDVDTPADFHRLTQLVDAGVVELP